MDKLLVKIALLKKLVLLLTTLLALQHPIQKFGGLSPSISSSIQTTEIDYFNANGIYKYVPMTDIDATNSYQVNVWKDDKGNQGFTTICRTLKTEVTATSSRDYFEYAKC